MKADTIRSQKQPDLVYQKKIVDLYDSSFMYSYNSIGRIFGITPQRVGQIHKVFKHDCPRLADKVRVQNGPKTAPVAIEEEGVSGR